MSHFIGVLLVFCAACSFGASGILIKLSYAAGLQPSVLLPLQNLVAILCLWPLLLISRSGTRLQRRQIPGLICQGLIGNFGVSICYFWSAQRIDISLLSIILFTYPGFVLLYVMLAEKRRITPSEWTALILAFTGGILASDPVKAISGRIDRVGIILAIAAAIAYAFMNVYGQKLASAHSSLTVTTITSTVSSLALAVVLPPQKWFATPISGEQWLYIAGLALLSTVLPMNLLYLGIRRIGAFHTSIVSVIELPCILVLAYFILAERMNPEQMLGAGLITAALVIMQPARKSAKKGAALAGRSVPPSAQL